MQINKLQNYFKDAFIPSNISLDKILIDEELEAIINSANPISATRTAHQSSALNFNLQYLTAHQSPMICYSYRNHFRLLAGLFTHSNLSQIQSIIDPNNTQTFPVFLLKNRPPRDIRRLIILHDLTTNLLEKCFINDTQRINRFLESWFEKDEGQRSIYQSLEWQTLFPELKTKSSVSNYLSLSKRDF